MPGQTTNIDIVLTLIVIGGLLLILVSWLWRVYRRVTMSSAAGEVLPFPVVEEQTQQRATSPVAPVATPQIDNNTTLRVAEDATIKTLAAVIIESRRKPFQNGEAPETRLLKVLFGVSPSSDPRSEYQRLRSLLRAELGKAEPPKPRYVPLNEDATIAADGIDRAKRYA